MGICMNPLKWMMFICSPRNGPNEHYSILNQQFRHHQDQMGGYLLNCPEYCVYTSPDPTISKLNFLKSLWQSSRTRRKWNGWRITNHCCWKWKRTWCLAGKSWFARTHIPRPPLHDDVRLDAEGTEPLPLIMPAVPLLASSSMLGCRGIAGGGNGGGESIWGDETEWFRLDVVVSSSICTASCVFW